MKRRPAGVGQRRGRQWPRGRGGESALCRMTRSIGVFHAVSLERESRIRGGEEKREDRRRGGGGSGGKF